MKRFKVGTSGYSYFWNRGVPTPFEWYVGQGFDTVEINASFYRFPSPSWIRVWSRAPQGFDFSVKVHRSVTHYAKLSDRALRLLSSFRETLKPIENRIAFWLFQMPPSFTPTSENLRRLKRFLEAADLGEKAVVEFRDPSWWRVKDALRGCGATFCSVDAPSLPNEIVSLGDVLYLRLHGRSEWYAYVYSREELEEIVTRVKQAAAERAYIYLNNDLGMLENGKLLLRLLSE